jgi:predicted LPLAT superfamily acyltransferase
VSAAVWSRERERGSRMLLRLMIWITLHLGWVVPRVILVGIALYFFLTSRRARAASREFLARARGRPATAADEFRHIFVFSSVIMESVFLISGRTQKFQIDIQGLDYLTASLRDGRGCVLLGAHLGSFEVLRSIARFSPVAVRPVMHRRNLFVMNVLEALDPTLAQAVIELGTPAAMLRIREALARGEIVGMLADRSLGEQKLIEAPFLGRPALFPAGPLLVAASLAAPILLFYGIRTGPRRYLVQFEPFAERIALHRNNRLAELTPWVVRFAASLEAQCRTYPFNWFNFYPFWQRS